MVYLNMAVVMGLTLVAGLVCALKPNVKKYEYWFIVMVGILLEGLYAFSWLLQVSQVFTYRLDEYSYVLDGYLGQPSFVLGVFMAKHPWIDMVARFAYNSEFIWMASLMSFLFCTQSIEYAMKVVKAMLINLTGAFVYFALPSSGPRYLIPTFPLGGRVIVHPHAVHIAAALNCFPSLHFSTALLFAWAVWRWGAGKVFGVLYAAAVALCTLGSGEHYLIDLFGSIPLVWLCVYCNQLQRKEVKISDRAAVYAS